MATRANIVQRNSQGSAVLARWIDLLAGDDGAPVSFGYYGDRSIQVTGTFGGATLRWEGSNDETNYVVLTNPQGTALDLSAAGIRAVTECTHLARPRVIGGDGTTSLTVTTHMRSGESLRRVIDDNTLLSI